MLCSNIGRSENLVRSWSTVFFSTWFALFQVYPESWNFFWLVFERWPSAAWSKWLNHIPCFFVSSLRFFAVNVASLINSLILIFFSYYRTSPSQADIAVFNGVSKTPEPAKYPHVARWYKHIASFQDDFSTLPGDTSAPASTYGPETAPAAVTPAAAPGIEEEDDEVDLFGSSDEEEDAAKEALTKKRLEEYAAKKVNLYWDYIPRKL